MNIDINLATILTETGETAIIGDVNTVIVVESENANGFAISADVNGNAVRICGPTFDAAVANLLRRIAKQIIDAQIA